MYDFQRIQMTIFFNKTSSQFEIINNGRCIDRARDYRAAFDKAVIYLRLSCDERRNEKIQIPQKFGKKHIAMIKGIADEIWRKRIGGEEQVTYNDCIKEAFKLHINNMWKFYTIGISSHRDLTK